MKAPSGQIRVDRFTFDCLRGVEDHDELEARCWKRATQYVADMDEATQLRFYEGVLAQAAKMKWRESQGRGRWDVGGDAKHEKQRTNQTEG